MNTCLQLWPGRVSDDYIDIHCWLYHTNFTITRLRHALVVSVCTYLCFHVKCCLYKCCILKISHLNFRTLIFSKTNAVNGLLSDITHTSTEEFPCRMIYRSGVKLPNPLEEVFARSVLECTVSSILYLKYFFQVISYKMLHDVDITIWESIHDMHFCERFNRSADCKVLSHNALWRYVQLQIIKKTDDSLWKN